MPQSQNLCEASGSLSQPILRRCASVKHFELLCKIGVYRIDRQVCQYPNAMVEMRLK